MTVLRRNRPRSSWSHASLYTLQSIDVGKNDGGIWASSSEDFSAPVTIQYSGKTKIAVKLTTTVTRTIQ